MSGYESLQLAAKAADKTDFHFHPSDVNTSN